MCGQDVVARARVARRRRQTRVARALTSHVRVVPRPIARRRVCGASAVVICTRLRRLTFVYLRATVRRVARLKAGLYGVYDVGAVNRDTENKVLTQTQITNEKRKTEMKQMSPLKSREKSDGQCAPPCPWRVWAARAGGKLAKRGAGEERSRRGGRGEAADRDPHARVHSMGVRPSVRRRAHAAFAAAGIESSSSSSSASSRTMSSPPSSLPSA